MESEAVGNGTRPQAGRQRRRAGWPRLWAIPALLVLVAAGLGLTLWPSPTATNAAGVAPDFTLPFASGGHGSFSLRQLRGHPVLLNFFNTQCPPCLDEMPVLKQTAQAYRKQGLIVLGVATGGDSVETARAFARAAHLPYPVVADAHQDVAWRYLVGGWPTSFFLDAQGKLRAEFQSALNPQIVRDGLAQAGTISCSNCTALTQPSIPANVPAVVSTARLDADVILKPRLAPFFALRDQNGKVIMPEQLRGKVVALTFISAICKEQCPLVGQALSLVRRQLGRDAARLAIVAISVDPEQDSPRATQAFAKESGWLGAEWHYLTAPRSVLSHVWSAYWEDVPPPSPIFKATSPVHDARVFLIDPRGRERAFYDVPFLPSRVAASVRALLQS